jgi:hypothetical protein
VTLGLIIIGAALWGLVGLAFHLWVLETTTSHAHRLVAGRGRQTAGRTAATAEPGRTAGRLAASPPPPQPERSA